MRYFQGLSAGLLLIVLIGFGRTLFLRPLFHVPSISPFLYVHGTVLAAWFVLLFVQTSLIAARRPAVHRRLGSAGALLAVAVFGLGLTAVLGFPGHMKQGRLSIDAPIAGSVPAILWTDLAALALFGAFVTTAVVQRHRPDVHKRLLILGSIALIQPAAARAGGVLTELLLLPMSVPIPGVIAFNLSIQALAVLGLPLTLLVHDLRTTHRVDPTTRWGLSAYYVAVVGAQLISASGSGRALVSALE